jgi:hypothetical protein
VLAPAVELKPYRERTADKVRRILGGPDTRPPASWPFPTWKGEVLRETREDGPPMPARRGPKTRPGHNAPIPDTDDETPDHGSP